MSRLVIALLAVQLSGCASVLNWYRDGKTPTPCEQAKAEMVLLCGLDPSSEKCTEAKKAVATKCEAVVEPPADPPPITPPADPPPSSPECVLAGEPTQPVPGYVMQLGEQVNAAIRTVTGQDGGRIVVPDGRQAFQARVAAALRKAGLCAGQHNEGTDEIAVSAAAVVNGKLVSTGPWEGWHVYAGSASGPGTAVLAPQAARGAWYAPGTEPAAPPPQPITCGLPTPPPLSKFTVHRRGSRPGWEVYDASPLVYSEGGTFCAQIGLFNADGITGRLFCSPRPEGHPERVACEAQILGAPAPRWVWTGAGGGPREDNPFGYEIPEGAMGKLSVCNADLSVCNEVAR